MRLLMLLGLCAAVPARAEILEATNGILAIVIRGPEESSPGLFSVRTGSQHPDPGRDVLYLSDPPAFTSYISLLDATSSEIWVNADDRGLGGWPGFTRRVMSEYPVSFSTLGTKGFQVSYMLPNVLVTQSVVIQGETLESTSVRHTVTLANLSGSPRQLGLRYLWDWCIGTKDDAYFRTRDPDGPFEQEFRTFYLPDFTRYEAADSLVVALVQVFGTVRGGSLLTPPTDPEELRFAPWDSAQEHPWLFEMPQEPGNYDDSAIVYYWGSGTPFEVGPGESPVFTQYITTNIEALRRPVPRLSKTVSPTGRVCAHDVLAYRISYSNIGDGTSRNLTITDTRPTWVEFVPGSLEFFAEPDHSGSPSLISRAWAPTYDGPWVSGDPPAGQAPPLNFRWVVDRVSPGRSGYIGFQAKVLDTAGWNARLRNEASATNMRDETDFWSNRVENIYGGMEMVKYPSPSEVLVGEEFKYRIVYYNDYCAAPVKDVRIWDTLAAGLEFISATDDGVYDGTKVDWTIGDLEPHTVGWVEVRVKVSSTSLATVSNCAQMDSRSEGSVPMPRVTACASPVTVKNPQLLFRKFAGIPGNPQPVPRDGELTYILDIINQFEDTVTNISIWDTLPPDVIFTEGDCTSDCEWDGTKLDWPAFPDIPPRSDRQIYITVKVSSTACYTCCENFASMAYSLDGGISVTKMRTNPVSASLVDPFLGVSKRVSENPATLGVPVDFQIVVTNGGGASAANIIAADPLPMEFNYASCDGPAGSSCSYLAGGVKWLDLPVLEPKAALTLTVTGVISSPLDILPPNVGMVSYSNLLNCPTVYAESTQLSVGVKQPTLTSTGREGSRLVGTGQVIDFSLYVENIGSDTALNVYVTDSLPAGLEYISCVAPPGGTCYLEDGLVVWSLTLPAGVVPEENFIISYTARVLITTTGYVIPEQDICINYTNRLLHPRQELCDQLAKLTVSDAILELYKVPDNNPVGEGSTFRYWLTLSNTGGISAKEIALWDSLPAGADFVGCSGTCLHDEGLVFWPEFPEVGANETKSVYISVLANKDMGCSNFAQADYSNAVPFPRPRIVSNSVCVAVVQPVIKIEMDVDKRVVRSGQRLDYGILVTNTGTGRAQKAKLWDSLPAGSLLLSCTPACSTSGGGTIVYWNLGSIDPGASEAMAFTVEPPGADCAGVTLFSESRVSYENTGAVGQPEVTGAAPPVLAVRSEIPLTLTPSAWAVRQGEELTYTVEYSNPCSDTAYGVVIWDSVPAYTQFIDCDPPCERDGDMVIWTLPPEVGPGDTGALRFWVKIDGTGPLIGPVTAIGDYQDVLGNSLPRTMSNSVTVEIASPRLEVEKTGPPRAVTQEGVSFTLRVRNVGTDTAYGVALVDAVPAPLRPPPSGGELAVEGSVVTWHVGDLGPGQEAALELATMGPELETESRVANRVDSSYHILSQTGTGMTGPWALHEVLLVPRLVFAVYPNPFNPKTAVRGTLKFTGLPPGTKVGIYTLTGVLVRDYEVAGVGRVEWDGLNDRGAEAAAGVYLWAVEFPASFPGERWRRGKVGLVR